jgi:hypothetical protein
MTDNLSDLWPTGMKARMYESPDFEPTIRLTARKIALTPGLLARIAELAHHNGMLEAASRLSQLANELTVQSTHTNKYIASKLAHTSMIDWRPATDPPDTGRDVTLNYGRTQQRNIDYTRRGRFDHAEQKWYAFDEEACCYKPIDLNHIFIYAWSEE